jgi:hypothetical protein
MDILDFLQMHLKKDIRKFGMTEHDYDKAKLVLNGCKITTQQSNYTQVKESIPVGVLFYCSFCLRFIKFEVFRIFLNDKNLILPK